MKTRFALPGLPIAALALAVGFAAPAAPMPAPSTRGDHMITDYFQAETARLAERCLADISSLDDWKARRETYRQQLFEMLSLSPLPARTDLKPVVTGRVEHEAFTVEKLHFQSLPGFYVTANLYLPKGLTRPAPAVLYLSGHGPVVKNGISYGNKVTYQHHGIWFARNGYACLILDTVQMGEIQGIHHGTHREGMWWWNARGYTSAGAEAWNCIRALDYLETRPEVDATRIGATGRSGGGAYSWWVVALDDRVKVAAPVAGITDLRNHVVDGVVEGHCDCMFTVNTYRWDYAQVAALVAPRPLLIVNTDSDTIFPLDGVMRVHQQVKAIYQLHRAATNLGVVIAPGPHKDTQDIQLPVFRWFNRHLKGEEPVIEMATVKLFEPEQLKVFATLPADARNARIHETFVPAAPPPPVPASPGAWRELRDGWQTALREKTFGAWPAEVPPLDWKQAFSVEGGGLRFQAYDFTSEPHLRLRLYLVQRGGLRKPDRVILSALGHASSDRGEPWNHLSAYDQWLAALGHGFAGALKEELAAFAGATNRPAPSAAETNFAALKNFLQTNRAALAFVAPRGIGLSAWNPAERKQTHIRRRFMLLGQTLDSGRVWDLRRAMQAVRSLPGLAKVPLTLQGTGAMGVNVLYASLYEPDLAQLDLRALPASHMRGPDYLNVLRILDVPQAVAMAAERSPVRLYEVEARDWSFPSGVARNLGWEDRLKLE